MNYYNENDAYPAQWLRNLQGSGQIPSGEVDERSIVDVQPEDLEGFMQAHFFAGIAGWSLALKLAGWPEDREVWTGSCPCQPFSVAGKRKGVKDKRHLWPDFRRLIAQCRPPTIFGEQVASKDGRRWLAGVQADLEDLGYAVAGADLCAAGVGSPHIRQRLWWVAYAERNPREQGRASNEPRESSTSSSAGTPVESGRRGDPRGMDNPTGSRFESSRQGTESQARDEARMCGPQQGRAAGRLVEPDQPRPQGRDQCGDSSHERTTGSTGVGGGLAITHGGEPSDRELQRSGEHGRKSQDGSSDGVGNPHKPECSTRQLLRIRAETRSELPSQSSTPSVWTQFDLLPCADGKARRVESGTFPLAHGVSARVGKLRAYGNAIVPQVAAEFIKAFLEAVTV